MKSRRLYSSHIHQREGERERDHCCVGGERGGGSQCGRKRLRTRRENTAAGAAVVHKTFLPVTSEAVVPFGFKCQEVRVEHNGRNNNKSALINGKRRGQDGYKGPFVAVNGELKWQKRSEEPNTPGLSRKRPTGVPNVTRRPFALLLLLLLFFASQSAHGGKIYKKVSGRMQKRSGGGTKVINS